MKRFFIVVSFTLLVLPAANARNIKNAHDAAEFAITLTEKYRLTVSRMRCLLFESDESGSFFDVNVRENHSEECGGDPNTAPTLFVLSISRDGKATTDAFERGTFMPVSEAARKIAARRAKEKHQQRSND